MTAPAFLLALPRETQKRFQAALERLDLPAEVVPSLDDLLARAPAHSLVFLPLRRFGMKGLSTLRGQAPALEVVAVASRPTVEEAAEAVRRGALDYLPRTADDERLAQTLGRWRGRLRLLAETASPDEVLTLMELGRTLTGTLQLDDLYEQMIEQVQRAFMPDTVSLMLLNPRTRRLRLVVQRGLPDSATLGSEVSVEESIAGRVVREGRPQLLLGGLQGTDFQELARRSSDIASAMSIPLQVQGKTLGVLNVNRHAGRPNYTEKEANLLHVFAAQIAIALQNAQLYESLRDERDRIIKAQEDVRRELARDLHDGLTQALASLAINIDHLRSRLQPGQPTPENIEEDLSFLRTTARQAIQDARTLNFGLRPLVLETQGLVAALKQYLATMREGDRTTTYHLDSSECVAGTRLAPNVARMVFAIVQEAISNARKHARGQNIWVTLHCPAQPEAFLLRATVRDDGSGFDLESVEGNYDQRLSFGLHNMKERAALIEATLHMESGPEGTCVELVVPWSDDSLRPEREEVGLKRR